MAESKKTTAEKTVETKEELVRFKLPRNKDPRASQDEFYSHNFKNYIIKRGEWVDLPKSLYDMIVAQEEAVEIADKFAESLSKKEIGV